MRQVFNLPDVGEGLTEAEILSWQVAVGDTVVVNQVLVEIETAKAAVELPSPYAGTVLELLAEPGVTLEVGTPIIVIGSGAEAPSEPAPKPATEPEPEPAPTADAEPVGAKIGEAGADGRIATLVGYGPKPGSVTRRARKEPATAQDSASRGIQHRESGDSAPRVADSGTVSRASVPLAKPPIRKLAKDLGVDLATLTGSGPNGVITRDDLERGTPAPAAAPATPSEGEKPGERRVAIRSVRRATAQAMVASAFTAPHVTEFLTVDVTPMMELRDRLRGTPEFRDVKLSPLVFAAKAVCLAARRTPELNAHWDDAAQEIVYYDRMALGIAAATPRGLVVPKVRNADTMSLRELAEALTELTTTARAGKTPPADMLGGTFTITNIGVFGIDTGTPILNPGEAGILALGAVKQAPWVVDGQLAVRTVCQLSLSFDHRLVDGEQGSRFLADVGALLADPGRAITY